MPLIMPNFIAIGQTVYEKSVTIFTPALCRRQGGLPGLKFISLGGDVQQAPLY